MIKTQLQSNASSQIAVGFQHNHSGLCSAVHQIYSLHGIQGLWRGWSGLCARLVFSSMAEMTVFMKLKMFLHKQQIFAPDSLMNSAVSSCLTSLAVVVAMTPFDVMATRLYNQPVDAKGKGILYRHLFDCAYKIIRQEGPLALYKGVTASACRVAPHVFLSLFFWDKLRTAAGLDDVTRQRSVTKLEDNLHELEVVPRLVAVSDGVPMIFFEKVAQGAGEHLEYTQPF